MVVEAEFNCTAPALPASSWRIGPTRTRLNGAPLRLATAHGVTPFRFHRPDVTPSSTTTSLATWSEPSGPVVANDAHWRLARPLVYFVSQSHLGDLDLHGDLLDVFDVVRLTRRAAWSEPVPFDADLRNAGVTDVPQAVAALLRATLGDEADTAVVRVEADDASTRVTFADGSTMVIPRHWSGRITDLAVGEGMAASVMTSRRPLRGLSAPTRRLSEMERCEQSVEVVVNRVFYRYEPQTMHRYAALSLDNIRRDPRGFLIASAYRAVRLFIIEGDSDPLTAHQFSGSGRIYALGAVVTAVLLILCIAGIAIGWWRGDRIGLPLVLIAYIPATLAPVLINMRYAVTVQPLMFVFVALAVSAIGRAAGRHAVVSSPSAG